MSKAILFPFRSKRRFKFCHSSVLEISRDCVHLSTNVRRRDGIGVCTRRSIDSRNVKLCSYDIHQRRQLARGKEKPKDELRRGHLYSHVWCERKIRIAVVRGDVVASPLDSNRCRQSSDRHVGREVDILFAIPHITSRIANR